MMYVLYYEMETTTSVDTFLTEDEKTRPLPTQSKLKKEKSNANVKESQIVSSEKSKFPLKRRVVESTPGKPILYVIVDVVELSD